MKKVLTIICLLFFIYSTKAQTRIAIINTAEPRLYFEYVAFTIFGNSDDSIPCKFSAAQYTEEIISSYLSEKYTVSKIELPYELQKYRSGPVLKKWIKSLNGKFDKVILISSIGITDYAHNTNAYLIGAGLYSRMGVSTEIYNTIMFKVFNTSNGKSVTTRTAGFYPLEGYVYADNKNQFNTSMCDLVEYALKDFINETLVEDLAFTGFLTKEELFIINNSRLLELQPLIEEAYTKNLLDSTLVTGWYYVAEEGSGFKRRLDKSDETYYIDPQPIAIQSNFSSVEKFETDFKGSRPDYAGLTIVLDDYGRKTFALATSKALDHRLALVINNKLVSAPLIKKIVTDAFTFLRRGEYNTKEIDAFMIEMGIEESKTPVFH